MSSKNYSIRSLLRPQTIIIGICLSLVLLYIFNERRFIVQQQQNFSQETEIRQIPKTIWHIFLHKRDIPSELHSAIHSWSLLNPLYKYHLIDTVAATNLLFEIYPTHPEVVHVFQRLESIVMRADFLRYVLLAAHGGVYTDIDTQALAPIDTWIPDQYRNVTNVVIGIEYDQRNDTNRHVSMPHSLSLSQWTMASTANHPLMWWVVEETMWSIAEQAETHQTDIEHFRPTDKEVIVTTGPALWTASIIKYLRTHGYPHLTYSDFSGLREPVLFGDVLVLPIDAFGSGQPHSGSTQYKHEEGSEQEIEGQVIEGALSRHLFKMSWRHSCSGVIGESCFN